MDGSITNENEVYVLMNVSVLCQRSADRAARMAGTVYRVLAGTDDVGLSSYPPPPHTRAAVNFANDPSEHSQHRR